MVKQAEIIHGEGNFERFVGPTPIERASRIGFSGFRDVGGVLRWTVERVVCSINAERRTDRQNGDYCKARDRIGC